ncbi:hypothetical protein JQ629_24600 [Bradyrhizobium sp. AUGA SZCCT0222]|uniref:hypothetical protein n=1 Tax=Bradyrhizobium sp. AUGA SZCCT0222 TaxID=2807668 RepID=UPI001BA7E934|nr:hypothetical protein [Bradyrhizobium sp. AUGA SZCCT0222]MBR1270659.1 hypothetical protein [Bradyrhizobium sp. AUGA SZCCT0222]
MRVIGSLASNMIAKHRSILVVLMFVVLLQIPAAVNLKSYILTGQDFNPVNFGQLFLHSDLPAADDVEIGENARTMSFSSLYMWMPLALHYVGLPLESGVLVHALFGLPLLLFGIYFLSFSLFRSSHAAALTALLFPAGNFGLFMTNVGYPILYKNGFYYGDFNHAFAAFALGFLIRGQIIRAAIPLALVLLINPTYGINVAEIFGMTILFSWRKMLTKETAVALTIVCLSILGAYIQIRASSPVIAPAPFEARRFAIEAYGHITGHIYDLRQYLLGQVTLVLILSFAVLREWRQKDSNNLVVAAAVLASFIVFGIVFYFLLFALAPEIFILLSPSKMSMIVSLWAACYAGYGLLEVFRSLSAPRLIAACIIPLAYFLGREGQYWSIWAASIWCSACAFLFAGTRTTQPDNHTLKAFCFVSISCALLIHLSLSTAWISNRGFFDVRDALLDIEIRASKVLPSDAMILPFRDAPPSINPYGMFANFPFRTYSRRGAVPWVVGRNAYFNSARRHELEEKVFQAATGRPLWQSILQQSEEMKVNAPAAYYFGLRYSDARLVLGTAGAWTIYQEHVDRMISAVNKMTPDEFRFFAGRAGANYILICKAPGAVATPAAITENAYFALIKVPNP